MLEGKSGRTLTVSRHDQRGDLDDLAFTPSSRSGVLLGAGEVPLRRSPVTPVRGQYRDQGVLDRIHHVDKVRLGTDSKLTSR